MNAWYLTRFGILGKVQLVEVQYILQDVVDGFCAHVLQHGIGRIGHSAAYHIPPVLQDELVEDDFRQLLYGLQVVNVLKGSLVRRAEKLPERQREHPYDPHFAYRHGHSAPFYSHSQQGACCYDVVLWGIFTEVFQAVERLFALLYLIENDQGLAFDDGYSGIE